MAQRAVMPALLLLVPAAVAALPPLPDVVGAACLAVGQVAVPTGVCEEWSATYGPTASTFAGYHQLPFATEAADGSMLFVGGTISHGDFVNIDDFNLLALGYDAATGALVWSREYDGPGRNAERAYAVAAQPGGDLVFLVGASFGLDNRADFVTIAYDARTGEERWIARSGIVGTGDEAIDVALSPDGSTVYVAGHFEAFVASQDFAVVAYDAATGVARWTTRIDSPIHGEDNLEDLVVSPDGSRVFVTGATRFDFAYDLFTAGVDAASGTLLWTALRDGSYANAIGVSPDGSRVFVTGRVTAPFVFDMLTIAFDAGTGEQLWTSRYDNPVYDGQEAYGLAVHPDGQTMYVVGDSWRSGFGNVALIRFQIVAYATDDGAQRAEATYLHAAPIQDTAYDIEVTPDGRRVYATGWSLDPATGVDYATVGYEADTLLQVWSARRHGWLVPDLETVGTWLYWWPALLVGDRASDLALSADGSRLYVAGVAMIPKDVPPHYLTLAYRPFDPGL